MAGRLVSRLMVSAVISMPKRDSKATIRSICAMESHWGSSPNWASAPIWLGSTWNISAIKLRKSSNRTLSFVFEGMRVLYQKRFTVYNSGVYGTNGGGILGEQGFGR